jgi:hypothetical protein
MPDWAFFYVTGMLVGILVGAGAVVALAAWPAKR